MKIAFVTGVTGQDGARDFERRVCECHRTLYNPFQVVNEKGRRRLDELGVTQNKNFHLIDFDLTDPFNSLRVLNSVEPDEVYNLAAQSFVGVSFDQPYATAQITGLGALNLLEAIREVNPKIRYYQASTSEMFGKVQTNYTPCACK